MKKTILAILFGATTLGTVSAADADKFKEVREERANAQQTEDPFDPQFQGEWKKADADQAHTDARTKNAKPHPHVKAIVPDTSFEESGVIISVVRGWRPAAASDVATRKWLIEHCARALIAKVPRLTDKQIAKLVLIPVSVLE